MTPSERVKAWRRANPGRRSAQERERYKSDPQFREEYLAKQRAYYQNNLEESRRKNREKRARLRKENPDPPDDTGRRAALHLKRRYGLTPADKEAMIAAQGGRCAICETGEPSGRWGWHVDHCHATGRIRGILCSKCNAAIGLLCDNPEIVKAAERYLRKHHDPDPHCTQA